MNKTIVIFASGSGSNAQNIIEYFADNKEVQIAMVFSNRKNAGVIQRAKKLGVATYNFSKTELYNSEKIANKLIAIDPDLIVLAGFLLKFPENILQKFENKVINIHPALLPKYGGKGMYGDFVHKAVLENKELQTGISIHYVNENYDEGALILQKTTNISPKDSIESIVEKVHELEHKWYPKVIDAFLQNPKKKLSTEMIESLNN